MFFIHLFHVGLTDKRGIFFKTAVYISSALSCVLNEPFKCKHLLKGNFMHPFYFLAFYACDDRGSVLTYKLNIG